MTLIRVKVVLPLPLPMGVLGLLPPSRDVGRVQATQGWDSGQGAFWQKDHNRGGLDGR